MGSEIRGMMEEIKGERSGSKRERIEEERKESRG